MQILQFPQRTLAILFGWAAAALGFFLSFVLAVTMLVAQANPGFLLIWLVAVFATGACMRTHARWRKSVERMYAPEAPCTFLPARKGWRQEVEDIAFRDLPGAAMPSRQ